MSNNPKILAVNPGSRYLGVAVFFGSELIEWGVRSLRQRSRKRSGHVMEVVVSELIELYEPQFLAIKKLHPSRSSKGLNRTVHALIRAAQEKGLKIYRFSLEEVEFSFSRERVNKQQLAEHMVALYPFLCHDIEREKASRNFYHLRMFEAVAIGTVCLHRLERGNKN